MRGSLIVLAAGVACVLLGLALATVVPGVGGFGTVLVLGGFGLVAAFFIRVCWVALRAGEFHTAYPGSAGQEARERKADKRR